MITQGKFPLNKKQQIALGFLFMVMIFDLFYSHVWVKDGILIWQPNWVVSCVEWIKNHLSPPKYSWLLELETMGYFFFIL